ncbi:hypothetical protein J6590_039204 [Homalodisca vitripennis]|nr:hypothetical protein J6590_039204 [Homalodisca vitripennis]
METLILYAWHGEAPRIPTINVMEADRKCYKRCMMQQWHQPDLPGNVCGVGSVGWYRLVHFRS